MLIIYIITSRWVSPFRFRVLLLSPSLHTHTLSVEASRCNPLNGKQISRSVCMWPVSLLCRLLGWVFPPKNQSHFLHLELLPVSIAISPQFLMEGGVKEIDGAVPSPSACPALDAHAPLGSRGWVLWSSQIGGKFIVCVFWASVVPLVCFFIVQ